MTNTSRLQIQSLINAVWRDGWYDGVNYRAERLRPLNDEKKSGLIAIIGMESYN